jgi:hypothetical protein
VEKNIIEAAARLSGELTSDIPLCKTREEHIRVTARANAALELLHILTASQSSGEQVQELDPISAG